MFLLTFVPNLYLFFYGEISLKSVLFLFMGASFCLFPALFLKSKIYFGIYFPFVLLAPLEIGHIIVNKVSVTAGFLLALFNTNASETVSYLSGFKIMIVLAALYWALYVYLWIKIPNRYITDIKKRKIGACFYAVLFAGISLLAIFALVTRFEKPDAGKILHSVPFSFKSKLNKTYPYSFIMKTGFAISEKKTLMNRYEKIKDFRFNPLVKSDDECETYVLVMGESARYANFGINGYCRNTTPFLDSLKMEGKLLIFSNVYASGNLTGSVLPLLLTRATVPEKDIANREKSIISLFREAGFKTCMLSNQGEGEPFLRQIAMEADCSYISNTDSSFDEKYDALLLPHIESFLNGNEKKRCIFIFTQGNHYKYNFRYPPDFEKFKPTVAKSYFSHEITEKNRELFVNAYDNAILYTDYFIHEIIKKIERLNSKSSLLYISDHGENIFDAPGINIGHGAMIPTKYELHVPMFIWFSESYLQANDPVIINLKNNADKKINSTNIFSTFANIAGIKYDLYQKEKDFSAETFLPDSVLWVLNPELEAVRYAK